MADKSVSDQQNEGFDKNSASQAPATTNIAGTDDLELDDLLDSALPDFDAIPKQAAQAQPAQELPASMVQPPPPVAPGNNPDEMFSDVFDAAFSGDEGAAQLEDMLKAFLDPDTLKNIEKIAEAAGTTDESDESKKQFEDTIKQTLGGLAQNAEELQNDVPEDELMRLMSSMGLGGLGGGMGGGDGGEGDPAGEDMDIMPMMQTMMKSLISKEVLYPSLKEIADKYPTWLSENRDSVSAEDLSRYEQQHESMKAICQMFEEESDTDDEEVKKERFAKILDMMQNMEKLGLPPKELTGDMPMGMPGFGGGGGFPQMEYDENGMPKMPSNPNQCSLM